MNTPKTLLPLTKQFMAWYEEDRPLLEHSIIFFKVTKIKIGGDAIAVRTPHAAFIVEVPDQTSITIQRYSVPDTTDEMPQPEDVIYEGPGCHAAWLIFANAILATAS